MTCKGAPGLPLSLPVLPPRIKDLGLSVWGFELFFLQDTSCFYSNRSRICPECKEKYLKAKRSRALRQSDLSFDAVYAACSKKNTLNRLCEVCVTPLETEGKGALRRVWCTDCKISKRTRNSEP